MTSERECKVEAMGSQDGRHERETREGEREKRETDIRMSLALLKHKIPEVKPRDTCKLLEQKSHAWIMSE